MTVLEKMNACEPGKTVHDTGEPNSVAGLHMTTRASGKRSFLFAYAAKFGVRRHIKIGENIGLGEARKRALAIKQQVALGLDPKANWEAQAAERTVGEAFAEVLEKHWGQERFVESGRQKSAKLIYTKYIEKLLGGQKLSLVKNADVRLWHNRLSQTPTAANRALEVLSKVYSYAVDYEWTKENPCTSVAAFTEKKRKRVATKKELVTIVTELRKILEDVTSKDAPAALYVMGLILTGARPKDLQYARWDNFKMAPEGYGVLKFYGKTTGDTGEEETLIFPKDLMELIERFPKRDDGRIFWVEGARYLWARIRAETGCSDLWSRDLRRTFASIGLSAGVSIDSIGETLNHKSAQTTKVYARSFDNSRVTTTNQIADVIKRMVDLK